MDQLSLEIVINLLNRDWFSKHIPDCEADEDQEQGLTCPAVSAGPPCTGNTERSTSSEPPQSRSDSAGDEPEGEQDDRDNESCTHQCVCLKTERK